MKSFTTLTASLVLATASTTVLSANWVEVAGNDSVSVFVDLQSLRRSGSKVKVWEKWIYTAPMPVMNSYPPKTYQSRKDLVMYQCTERRSGALQLTEYVDNDTGEVVGTLSRVDKPSLYSEVIPDSIGEAILEFVCNITKPRKK